MHLIGSTVLFSVLLQAMVGTNERRTYVAVLKLAFGQCQILWNDWMCSLFDFHLFYFKTIYSLLFYVHFKSKLPSLNFFLPLQSAPTEDWQKATSIYDFSAVDIDGNLVSLEKYRYISKTYSLPKCATAS